MTVDEQIDKTLEESLNQKLEQVTKELVTKTAFEPRKHAPAPTQQVLDMGRLLAAGARLLKSKTEEHRDEISSYGRQRTQLIDDYRIRMEMLKIEADEQLRLLDQEHEDKLASLEKIISKLRMLREG